MISRRTQGLGLSFKMGYEILHVFFFMCSIYNLGLFRFRKRWGAYHTFLQPVIESHLNWRALVTINHIQCTYSLLCNLCLEWEIKVLNSQILCGGSAENFRFWLFLCWFGDKLIKNKKFCRKVNCKDLFIWTIGSDNIFNMYRSQWSNTNTV